MLVWQAPYCCSRNLMLREACSKLATSRGSVLRAGCCKAVTSASSVVVLMALFWTAAVCPAVRLGGVGMVACMLGSKQRQGRETHGEERSRRCSLAGLLLRLRLLVLLALLTHTGPKRDEQGSSRGDGSDMQQPASSLTNT